MTGFLNLFVVCRRRYLMVFLGLNLDLTITVSSGIRLELVSFVERTDFHSPTVYRSSNRRDRGSVPS